ncbi:hypothetical protein [Tenacibaculum ovolyticum]|uniref:hypothetical protein n=1 Tax=Tenacibaculum ovolyticum TaxID=104270 RepID=UPI0004282F7C|nr:hypothetical protein [Tenacibaculum ovolyticum]
MKLHDFEKPYYTIYPHIYCSGIIYINDVPAITWLGEETKEGGFGGDIPINQLVLESGKHAVKIVMLPRINKKTLTEEETFFADFYLSDVSPGRWKETSHKFHPKIESPWNGLSEGINYPIFELKTEIEVELPYVLDGWQNSQDLTEIKEEILFRKVFSHYQQIHAVLAEHNVSKFLELSKEKMQLQEQAFYFSEERKKQFYEGALSLFSQNLKVEPLMKDELKLQIMGYGKLVRLIKLDGSEPLQYMSPNIENQSNIELEVKLHMRSEEKGFSII